MTIGKDKPHGIRSNWFNPFDFDVPSDGIGVSRSMPAIEISSEGC